MEKWLNRVYTSHYAWTVTYYRLWIIEWTSQILNKQYTEFGEPIFKEDDNSIWYYALSRDSENKRKLSSKKIDFCTTYSNDKSFRGFCRVHTTLSESSWLFRFYQRL